MAIKTTLEQLEEVQAAISKAMSGQAVTIDGERIERPDIAALSKREQILLARYRSENGQGITTNTAILRRG